MKYTGYYWDDKSRYTPILGKLLTKTIFDDFTR